MSDVVWGVPHGRATHRLGAGVGCKSLRISNTCSGRANTRTQGARGSTVPLLSRERVRLILAMRSAKTGAVRSPRMRSVRAHTLPLVDSPLYTRAPRAHGTKFHAAQRLPPWQGHGGGRGARIVSAAVVASHALVPRQARTRPRTPLARWPGTHSSSSMMLRRRKVVVAFFSACTPYDSTILMSLSSEIFSWICPALAWRMIVSSTERALSGLTSAMRASRCAPRA